MIEYKLLELTYRAYHKPVLRYYLYLVLIFRSRFVIFMTIKIRREIHIRRQIYHYISNKFTEYIMYNCLFYYFDLPLNQINNLIHHLSYQQTQMNLSMHLHVEYAYGILRWSILSLDASTMIIISLCIFISYCAC